MFRNIGDKIKIVAETICWVGIVSSILTGLVVIAKGNEDSILMSLFIGLLIMVLGSLFSWIGSFVLYGFGQLIENSDILVDQIDEIEARMQALEESYDVESRLNTLNKQDEQWGIAAEEIEPHA